MPARQKDPGTFSGSQEQVKGHGDLFLVASSRNLQPGRRNAFLRNPSGVGHRLTLAPSGRAVGPRNESPYLDLRRQIVHFLKPSDQTGPRANWTGSELSVYDLSEIVREGSSLKELRFLQDLKYDDRGLIPVVVQDAETGRVLTLAYMNQEALIRTVETGKTWFYRRSLGKVMMKGTTSGNVQIVKRVLVDCDRDALVVQVQPQGPACHEGYRSCFFQRVNEKGELETFLEKDCQD